MNKNTGGVRKIPKKSPNTEVPPLGNPDRKRSLNVLAQRRYRQRRQNKIAELEAKVNATPEISSNAAADRFHPSSPRPPSPPATSLGAVLPTPDPSPLTNEQFDAEDNSDGLIGTNQHSELLEQENNIFVPGNEIDIDVEDVAFSNIGLDMGINPELVTFANGSQNAYSSSHSIGDGLAFENNLALQPSSNHESLNFNFPVFVDDSFLEMPSLKVVKAAKMVMNKLGVGDELWDPTATWILDAAKFPFDVLPAHYRPTDAQLSVPHHPFIDALPWPTVRNKLIWTFAQPPQLRPPSARDPMAVMFLALDIDDDAEGVRIRGADGLDEKSWELGQTIFKNWWWAFSRSIIDNSNRLRKGRGAGQLRLQPA